MIPRITVLGVGNVLYTDEGFGVRVVERMEERYLFPDDVLVIDGGVLGVNLLGILSQPQYLIVVDIVRYGKEPGSLYRLAEEEIPKRILAKMSLHQVDLIEALTLCQALDHVPETVIVGVEPEDMTTFQMELTATIEGKIDAVIDMVLKELDRLGATYEKKENPSCA
jgi:hydrogenase maturation protease